MASQDAALALAQDPVIAKSAEAYRVFMYLVSRLDFENYIQVAQTEIASDLGLKKQNVGRAIKILVERKVIIQGPKAGHSYSWRLNHDYGWKGKVKNLTAVRRKHLSVVTTNPERCTKTKDMFSEDS